MMRHKSPERLPIFTDGPPGGQPVILLHGFLADSRQWRQLTRLVDARVSRPVRWLLPDLPGHGAAAVAFPDEAGWPALVHQLADALRPQLTGAAMLGGYSMGGRIASALAGAQVLKLLGLWLESAHPPLNADAARLRRDEDEARALRLETLGLADFVRAWEELPLFASQKSLSHQVLATQRRIRLSQDARGLAQSLRRYGTGTMPDDVRVDVPTRLLVGDRDAGLLARVGLWHTRAPDLTMVTAPDAGHAVHLEQPELAAAHLAEAISAAFQRVF